MPYPYPKINRDYKVDIVATENKEWFTIIHVPWKTKKIIININGIMLYVRRRLKSKTKAITTHDGIKIIVEGYHTEKEVRKAINSFFQAYYRSRKPPT